MGGRTILNKTELRKRGGGRGWLDTLGGRAILNKTELRKRGGRRGWLDTVLDPPLMVMIM